MTNKEIFKKCMDIVSGRLQNNNVGVTALPSFLSNNDLYESVTNGTYYRVIFSHEFAKLFWGEFSGKEYDFLSDGERYTRLNEWGFPVVEKDWRYHLPIMVMQEQPLKYLEVFLD